MKDLFVLLIEKVIGFDIVDVFRGYLGYGCFGCMMLVDIFFYGNYGGVVVCFFEIVFRYVCCDFGNIFNIKVWIMFGIFED